MKLMYKVTQAQDRQRPPSTQKKLRMEKTEETLEKKDNASHWFGFYNEPI